MDLKERPDRRSVTGKSLRSCAGIYEVTKPIVAAIDGHCLGGGLTMTMWADIRLAAETTVFGFPEIRHGIHPNTNYFIAQNIPVCVIAELALEAADFTARRACEAGFINRVVRDDRLMDEARATAGHMASFPLRVLKAGKQLIRKSTELPMEVWDRMAQHRVDTYLSDDEAEGVAAFRQGRKPRWTSEST